MGFNVSQESPNGGEKSNKHERSAEFIHLSPRLVLRTPDPL